MTIIQSIILGIVEGLTEFLPVSSTGHMILASSLLKIAETDFLKTFEISIQLGSILAVVFLYFKKFFNLELLTKLFIAFLPTGIIGIILFKHIKVWLGSPMIVVYSLFIGGIAMLLVEIWYKNKKIENVNIRSITYKQAFLLGLCQSVAMIPGISRSGAMIVGGLLMKLKRDVLVEFTFLLAVPTMFVATAYTLFKDKEIFSSYTNIAPLLIGFIISFVIALLVVKWFLNFIRTKDFTVFGWYSIIISIISFFVIK